MKSDTVPPTLVAVSSTADQAKVTNGGEKKKNENMKNLPQGQL